FNELWLEDGKANRSKRNRKPRPSGARNPPPPRLRKTHAWPNAPRFRWQGRVRSPTCSAPAWPRTARCSNRRLPISIDDWLRWKIPKPKSQKPNPKNGQTTEARRTRRFENVLSAPSRLVRIWVWDLGFGIRDLKLTLSAVQASRAERCAGRCRCVDP